MEHLPCWLYLFYPAVLLIRLASIFNALITYTVFTGSIPYFTHIAEFIGQQSLDIFHWLVLISSYVLILPFMNWICYLFSWFIPWIAFFWMDCLQPNVKKKDFGSLQAYDVRYLVFSAYCLYPWWSYLLSSGTATWLISYIRAINKAFSKLSWPSRWMLSSWITHPPDGLVTRLLFTLVILTYYIGVIGRVFVGAIPSLLQHIFFYIKDGGLLKSLVSGLQ